MHKYGLPLKMTNLHLQFSKLHFWLNEFDLNLSSCVSNSHQTLTRQDLRCDFWLIMYQEVHGLASSA